MVKYPSRDRNQTTSTDICNIEFTELRPAAKPGTSIFGIVKEIVPSSQV